MMKKIFLFIAVMAAMLSCSQEENTGDTSSSKGHSALTINGTDFEIGTGFNTQNHADKNGKGPMRTALRLDETKGLQFTWSEGDRMGVFGESGGQQVVLKMTSGAGTKQAQFSSEDFQLAAGKKYVAYYPLVNLADATPFVDVDYTGQTQDGNNSYDHLAKYDYLVSDAAIPTATNNLDLQLHHVGTILRLRITMPSTDSYKQVVLSSEDNAFDTKVSLDLLNKNGNGLINATASSNETILNLSNTSTTEDNKLLTVWMMLSPTDLTSKNVNVTVKSATEGTDDVVFSFTPTKKFEQGKAYSYDLKQSTMEYVDLGLPSGTLWGKWNVGASKPEDYGGYYAWGENEFMTSTSMKDYKGYWLMDALNSNADYKAKSNYDTAMQILGNNWVTPNQDDWIELTDENNTSCEWTTSGGVNGLKVTSLKNGNSIFLPASGYWSPSAGEYKYLGTQCRYWTSEFNASYYPEDSRAIDLYCDSDLSNMKLEYNYYYFGCSVRPIYKK